MHVKRHLLIGTAVAAATTAALTAPAVATQSYQGNPAGNGQMTHQVNCPAISSDPLTLVAGNNNSSDKGGNGAVRLFGTHGEHFTIVSGAFELVDMTRGNEVLLTDQFTKGQSTNSVNANNLVTCSPTAPQPATDDSTGKQLTVQDAINSGFLDPNNLPANVQPTDLLGFTFTANVYKQP